MQTPRDEIVMLNLLSLMIMSTTFVVLSATVGCATADFEIPPELPNPHPHFAGDGDGPLHVASEERALVGMASAGCGQTPPYAAGTTTEISITITWNGSNYVRTGYLQVPNGYDENVPQREVIALHGRGGSGQTIYSWGVWHNLSGVSFYLDALAQPYCQNQACWDHKVDGEDMAFLDQATMVYLESNFCIDTGRRFAYGFSMGAIFLDIYAHSRSTFQAIYAVEGMLASDTGTFNYSNVNWDAAYDGSTLATAWNGQGNTNDNTIGQPNLLAEARYFVTSEFDGAIGDATPFAFNDGSYGATTYTTTRAAPMNTLYWATPDGGGHGPDGAYGALLTAIIGSGI